MPNTKPRSKQKNHLNPGILPCFQPLNFLIASRSLPLAATGGAGEAEEAWIGWKKVTTQLDSVCLVNRFET